MNYDAAIKEIYKISNTIEEMINEKNAEDVLTVIEQDIHSAIVNIYKESDVESYSRWLERYTKAKSEAKNFTVVGKYDVMSDLLNVIRRDLEQRKRLAIQSVEDDTSQRERLLVLQKETQQQAPFRFLFYITVLVMISSWIWMVPVLVEKSHLIWQLIAQVAVVVGWLAVYSKFKIENIKKEAIISGLVQISIGLIVAFLSHTFGWG